jgi:hypothetical protein
MRERLTDEQLDWLERRCQDEIASQMQRYVVALIAEVRTHREAASFGDPASPDSIRAQRNP